MKLMADMKNPEFARTVEESLRGMGGDGALPMPAFGDLGLDPDSDASIAATLQMLAKLSTEAPATGVPVSFVCT